MKLAIVPALNQSIGMKINADLSKRAVVASESLPWTPSPLAGVDRRMLERDGDEVARATSIVRYAPNSFFSAHTHDMGEEFLVLSGIFSDETGDYASGMYVRNPPASKHTPSSAQGCLIFVKLRQMHPDDSEYVRIDTHDPSLWRDGRRGEKILGLYEGFDEKVCMLSWSEGSIFEPDMFNKGVEYLVIKGRFEDDQGIYETGSWLRLPAGTQQSIQALTDSTVYRKTGHLPSPSLNESSGMSNR